jgi:Holliday junction resolvase
MIDKNMTSKEEKTTAIDDRRIKIEKQIKRLETQYKEYAKYTLGELTDEINFIKFGEKFEEKSNCIYISAAGFNSVFSKIDDNEKVLMKGVSHYQFVLGKKVTNDYVTTFFRSALGELSFDALSSTSSNQLESIKLNALKQILVAVPDIKNQEMILKTQRKMSELKLAIDKFVVELALNPTSSIILLSRLDAILETIGALTDIDKVHNIIRQGETKTTEFKETLFLDTKTKQKKNYIQDAVLKTIVAFLNSKGGVLLIGVNDEGEITGVDAEINILCKDNRDKYLLRFKNLIKSRIGEQFYPFIEYDIISIDKKNILMVECKSSNSPCYLSNSEFYVRTNPATDKLEGPKLVSYIQNHFK